MIRSLIVAAALAAAGPVVADSIARKGADWVRLSLKPCANTEVVAHLERAGAHADAFRAGSAHFGGQDYGVCWQPANGGALLVYSDGDTGFVPVSDLKPAPEA